MYISACGSKSWGLSRLQMVILISSGSSLERKAKGVPHFSQKYRFACEEEFSFLGSPLMYSKDDKGRASQETNGAPEICLHVEQWQFTER